MKIINTTGIVISVLDLTPTAREITLMLNDELDIVAGAFVNLFLEIDGKRERRAFSISSDYKNKKEITLSIRHNKYGKVSPIFWQKDIIGKEFGIMGALGINTSDKMKKNRVHLFSFGIGASVIKGVLHGLLDRENLVEVNIITGNRNEEEILYKNFFENIQTEKKITTKYILSQPIDKMYKNKGYLQDYIDTYIFDGSDIYICGQEAACEELAEKIQARNPSNIQFFIEGFH